MTDHRQDTPETDRTIEAAAPPAAQATAPAAETSAPPSSAEPDWSVIGPDGGHGGAPTAEERTLLARAKELLAANEHFRLLAKPVLSKIEVNRGVNPDEPGYLYLRYDEAGAVPQEFWPHWGKKDGVNWKSGLISVTKNV